MDEIEIKHVLEAALLAAGRPLTLDRLSELFAVKGDGPDRATLKRVLETLANDYQGRGIELKEVATGYRVQVRRSMSDWLLPLWEERAPRYTRALLETLALIAYRQPITRAEIEEVRGVVVSTNIMRTLLERSWVRVVGHRDVPGKPAMFGTTKEFLDYFGLKKLEDLPPLADLKDGLPELSPQTDLIESLEAEVRGIEVVAADQDGEAVAELSAPEAGGEPVAADPMADDDEPDSDDLTGPDIAAEEEEPSRAESDSAHTEPTRDEERTAEPGEAIPLRAVGRSVDGND
jgi:segregation and condensation protein B